jgi:hypothetical protein
LRTVTIRNVVLGSREWIVIGLHPFNSTVDLRANGDGLELCPGDAFGTDSLNLGFSGLTCSPFTGSYATPQRQGGHVGIGLRNTRQQVLVIPPVEIRYEAADKFFLAEFPPLPSGMTSPLVEFVPTRDVVVAATVFRNGYRSAPVRAELTQRSIGVSRWTSGYQGDGDPYGPVKLNDQVTVRTTNTTSTTLERYSFFLGWA